MNVAERISGIRFTWLHKTGGIAGVSYVFDFLDKLVECTALIGPDGVLLQTGLLPYMQSTSEVCCELVKAYETERANVDPHYVRGRGLFG